MPKSKPITLPQRQDWFEKALKHAGIDPPKLAKLMGKSLQTLENNLTAKKWVSTESGPLEMNDTVAQNQAAKTLLGVTKELLFGNHPEAGDKRPVEIVVTPSKNKPTPPRKLRQDQSEVG